MKALAIALPILVAATLSVPAQAKDFSAQIGQGNFVLSISSNQYSDRNYVDRRTERKRVKRGKRHYVPLSPRQISRILKNRGFYNIRKMRTDGRVYTLKARGRRGNLVRLTVSAKTGQIKHRKVLRRMQRVDGWNYRNDQNLRRYNSWRQSQYRDPFWMN